MTNLKSSRNYGRMVYDRLTQLSRKVMLNDTTLLQVVDKELLRGMIKMVYNYIRKVKNIQ
jgi:hypothetical protein